MSAGVAAPGNWGSYDEIIDVRTPDEYRIDHIPRALNLPVLNGEQRSEVGTMYKQSSFSARRRGAALVARNIAAHLERELSGRPRGWRPLVYCWRGGQRSRAFVQVMREIGWDAQQLEGGYKSYRRWTMDMLEELPGRVSLLVLAGRTGAGKTLVLRQLRELGAPTVDLEGLAVHRGSVFGSLGRQPSQRRFESGLCMSLWGLGDAPFAFVESESRKIGSVHVPGRLLAKMREAPVIRIEAALEHRARHIASEYRNYVESPVLFRNTLEQIVRYAGKARVAEWIDLHAEGCYEELVERLLGQFYDVGYDRSLSKNYGQGKVIASLAVDPCDAASVKRAARNALAAATTG